MKKGLGAVLIFWLLVLFCPMMGQAASSVVLALTQTSPATYFYSSSFDNLALEFTLGLTDSQAREELQALTVKNQGTARNQNEIEKLVLWADEGTGQFEGFAIDREVAVATYDADNNAFIFSGLSESITSQAKRFFVSVETRRGGTNGRTFQFSIPVHADLNSNGQYNNGDLGVFLTSKAAVPTEALINARSAAYRTLSSDSQKPISVITNLKDNQTLTSENYAILGQSKDQGGSNPVSVQVCIDAVCKEVTSAGAQYITWQYDWTGIIEGDHVIYVKTLDFNNNLAETSAITVTKYNAQKVSTSKSTVLVDKTTVVANGTDRAVIRVYVRDSQNAPIANKPVYLNEVDGGVPVVLKTQRTGSEGLAIFYLSTTDQQSYTFRISVDTGEVLQNDFQITFAAAAPETTIMDFTDGTWVKIKNQSAVYFLDKNDKRHAYPTQAVWESYFGADFSKVKTISADLMATYPLGANVPMKAGSLIKFPSVPKVYKIEAERTRRWVTTEATAKSLFGKDWNKLVRVLPESFYTDYTDGENL